MFRSREKFKAGMILEIGNESPYIFSVHSISRHHIISMIAAANSYSIKRVP